MRTYLGSVEMRQGVTANTLYHSAFGAGPSHILHEANEFCEPVS